MECLVWFFVSAVLAVNPRYVGPLGGHHPPEIGIECPAFSGSLGTLVQCVVSRKIDLREIPIHPICVAYAQYLIQSDVPDLDGAMSALLALAYLVERKAEGLLPVPEPEPTDELEYFDVGTGVNLGDFRPVLQALNEQADQRDLLFFRNPGDDPGLYELPVSIHNVAPIDLGRALEQLLAKAIPESPEPLGRPRRSLAEQMNVVLRCLNAEPRPIQALVEGEFTRLEAVWWFLALLELIRTGQAMVDVREDGDTVFWRPDLS